MLQVDTAPTPYNDSPAEFRLESWIDSPEFKLEALVAITEQKDRNSGFESWQQTVAVTFFSKAERVKSETLLKSELEFCTVSVD